VPPLQFTQAADVVGRGPGGADPAEVLLDVHDLFSPFVL
jgi:hypothetical protein